MARKFTKTDVRPWRAATRQGKTLRGKDGKPLNTFKGYADAQKAADKFNGVAVRV